MKNYLPHQTGGNISQFGRGNKMPADQDLEAQITVLQELLKEKAVFTDDELIAKQQEVFERLGINNPNPYAYDSLPDDDVTTP